MRFALRCLVLGSLLAGCAAAPESAPMAIARAQTLAYLDARALAWARKSDWSFVDGGRCAMSCHSTFPWLATRAAYGDTPAIAEVRGFIEARVGDWRNARPWYSWLAGPSHGSETVLNAAGLALADAAAGRSALSAKARLAFEHLWDEQGDDGAWPFMDTLNLYPWEGQGAAYWGAAQVALAVGSAPGGYLAECKADPKRAAKLAALIAYLRDGKAQQALHQRAVLLLASTKLPDLLSPTEARSLKSEIAAAQRADGSWSQKRLGLPAGRDEPGTYATALFVSVLRASGGDAAVIRKGQDWLRAKQAADGSFPDRSLNKPGTAWNDGLLTDAATAWALTALGGG